MIGFVSSLPQFFDFLPRVEEGEDVWGFEGEEGSLLKDLWGPLWPSAYEGEVKQGILSLVFRLSTCIWPALFIVTLVAIAIGAIKWISSQGDEGKAASAKKWVTNAVVGFGALMAVFIGVTIVAKMVLGLNNILQLNDVWTYCGDTSVYERRKDAGEWRTCCVPKCTNGETWGGLDCSSCE